MLTPRGAVPTTRRRGQGDLYIKRNMPLKHRKILDNNKRKAFGSHVSSMSSAEKGHSQVRKEFVCSIFHRLFNCYYLEYWYFQDLLYSF